MQVSIEISLYPLQKEFTPAIDRFIKVLQDYDDIEVRTNAMSTQLFGELDTLMDILKMEVKNVFNRELQSVFTLKIVNYPISSLLVVGTFLILFGFIVYQALLVAFFFLASC